MEFGSINVVPERSCFAKSDIVDVKLRPFDHITQTRLTASFISYVENCYEIMDTQLLEKIVPEKFSNIYHQDEVIKEIVSFFKIYGIQIDSTPLPTDHFSAVQNSIYKNNDSNIVYTREDFIKDCENDEDEEFNFTSKNINKYLNIISIRMQKPIIALYYTPIGFLRASSQILDSETICNSYFYIILGQDLCITPEFIQFDLIHPQENSYGERKAGLTFFQIIKFELINGIYQPIFEDHSFAHFTRNCTNLSTRTDSYLFPYESLVGRSTILIGLIGTYSTIVKFLSHNAIKVNLVGSFDDTYPFIGVYIPKTAYVYVFLYIPNDLPPNHPMYRDVTVYATSLMQRICTRTFFLSEDDSNFLINSDFHIGGLNKKYGNRILGSFDTSLILHCDQLNFIGKEGKNFIKFNSCDEFVLWKKYISRRFQINPISSAKVQNNSISFNQLIQLISDNDYSSNKLRIEKIINGKNNSKISEIDKLIKQSYLKFSKDKSKENKEDLLSFCKQKMDELTQLFNQASLWMKASSFVLLNHCQFCDVPCDEKPDQDSPLWSSACFRCKLEQTQKFNKTTRGSKRPTQFLEEKVEEIVQNEKDCEMFHSIFRDYLLNKKSYDINNQSFTKWLYEYWTTESLNKGIDKIKTNENIEINEDVKSQYKKCDDFSLLNFIIKLTGNQLEGIEYYSVLPSIFLQVPFEKDSDSIRDSYLSFYLDNIVPLLCEPPELSPYMFYERCKEEIESMAQTGFVDDSIVEILNVSSTKEEGNSIEVEINWKEKNSERDKKSLSYTFYSISDISLLNPSFTSKPMNCTSIVSLYSQPLSLFIVNSFYLSKFNRTIIVSILGQSLWINVVKDGFNSSFLPEPIFSLEVEKDSGQFSSCSFASLANLIVLFFKSKSGEFYFYSIQISRDFNSSNVVAHRSFKQIAPLSSKKLFSSKLYGFTVSNDASIGLFCSDYCYSTVNDDKEENHEFALIRFDPWTLIANQREDSFDLPFNPIFINSSFSSLSYDIIFHCENDNSSLIPQKSRLFRAPLEGKRLDEVFGLVLWRGEPRIVKLNDMNEPVFELPDSYRIETPLSFLPSDAITIVSDSIKKFGLSEIDRISANGHYPIDSVTVDSIIDIQNHKDLVDLYFQTGKETVSRGIELHLFAHQNPSVIKSSNNDSCSLMDIDIKPKERNDPKKSFFPFFHRITAAPRFLIKSPIHPIIRYSHGCTTAILEESFIVHKSNFPPLPLIRELLQRGQVESKTFSVVNGSSSSTSASFNFNNEFKCGLTCCSDGKDTEILSAYSGIQFVNTPPGSVRLGSLIVPTEFNKLRKFDKFYLLNALSFAPFDPNSAIHCALALLHSIYCSGAVTFVTRKSVDFVVKVFKMMRDSISTIENSAQHVNYNFSCSNDDDENLIFEPANFIVVVCDLGKQYEREAEKLKNEISSLIDGFGPGDICYDILSKEIVAIPIDLSSQEIARIIADSIVLPSVDLEESTRRILDFVASYGSFIDNTYLFKFE